MLQWYLWVESCLQDLWGESMIDIMLDENMGLVAAATGDVPLAGNENSLLQELRMEAQTQQGELFYDETFGWSLLDFVQAEDSALVRTEITARIRSGLSRYTQIDPESVEVLMLRKEENLYIQVRFRLSTTKEQQRINVTLNRVRIEVMAE